MPSLPDWPRRHRPWMRGSKLHHKAPRRDDDQAPRPLRGGPDQRVDPLLIGPLASIANGRTGIRCTFSHVADTTNGAR